MRTHRPLLQLLTAIAAVLCALGLGEAGLRLAGPAWLRAHMRERAAGRQILGATSFENIERVNGRFARFSPNVSFALLSPEYQTTVHITRWGTRATGRDEAGPDTVVFAGDSFTFGMGVNEDETFVSVVCGARRVACLNAGFPGSSLPSQLDAVEENFAAWGRPRRIVFVFYAGNDLPEMIFFERADRGRPQPAVSQTARLAGRVNRVLNATPALKRSYLLQLIKAAGRVWMAPQGMDLMFYTASGARGDFGREAEAAVDRSLDRLARVSSALGFSPAFVMIPDRLQIYAALRDDKTRYYHLNPGDLDFDFPQRTFLRALEKRGLTAVDVRACADARADGLYYRSDDHLTPAGHAAVGRCLLAAAGLF